MTTLYGWPPMFGARGPSPFPLKADIQLQMLCVPFDRKIADLESVSKHKAPYVEDDGEIIQDSTFIRWHFERKLGEDLDAGLNLEQRAAAWAMERMLEDRLYHIIVSERWLEPGNFERGPQAFFMGVPEAMRQKVMDDALASLRTMHQRHGLGRHTRAERMMLADCDIAAASALLGEKIFMFGDKPTALDAAAYGMLALAAAPAFDTPLIGLVEKRENLGPYLARMDALFFDDAMWAEALNAARPAQAAE